MLLKVELQINTSDLRCNLSSVVMRFRGVIKSEGRRDTSESASFRASADWSADAGDLARDFLMSELDCCSCANSLSHHYTKTLSLPHPHLLS
jgi:hypothetical protein